MHCWEAHDFRDIRDVEVVIVALLARKSQIAV